MKATLITIAMLATFVSADDGHCAAQNILDSCLSTTQGYLGSCSSQDWSCLCEKCFNNCPSDGRKVDCGNQQKLYCMNASLYQTATAGPKSYTWGKPSGPSWSESYAVATTAPNAPKETLTAPHVTGGGGGGGSGGGSGAGGNPHVTETPYASKTTSAIEPLKSAGAAELAGHGAGMLAAVAGLAAVLL
ncbi:hypothetical protein F5Y19DRAFT_480212 [Xylariaceae sp. FL1651]|nr:hypothetical protein F5Y19DRAFT_480212 [Xylariaceae sp. FL1651]